MFVHETELCASTWCEVEHHCMLSTGFSTYQILYPQTGGENNKKKKKLNQNNISSSTMMWVTLTIEYVPGREGIANNKKQRGNRIMFSLN